MQLKSSTVRDWFMFFVLVGLGAAGRWLFRDIPNFTPTAGVAVFAGLYFRSPLMAFLVPLAVMVVSNIGIESYGNWGMLAVVYVALLFPVALSRLLSRKTGNRRSIRPMGMVACGVLPSIFFFHCHKLCRLVRRGTLPLNLGRTDDLFYTSHPVLSLHALGRSIVCLTRSAELCVDRLD